MIAEPKKHIGYKGEFLERLAFFVTFLAMKKVTKKNRPIHPTTGVLVDTTNRQLISYNYKKLVHRDLSSIVCQPLIK
jgi:hypothetical protein